MKTFMFFWLICIVLYQVECFIIPLAGYLGYTYGKNSKSEAPRVDLTALTGEKTPAMVVVDETNEVNFGVPAGTLLELDQRTGRYKPPPVTDCFTADDRMKLLWTNKVSRPNFCMESPGNLSWPAITYDYYLHKYCTDDEDNDICCDNKICSCNLNQINCQCLTPNQKATEDAQNLQILQATVIGRA